MLLLVFTAAESKSIMRTEIDGIRSSEGQSFNEVVLKEGSLMG